MKGNIDARVSLFKRSLGNERSFSTWRVCISQSILFYMVYGVGVARDRQRKDFKRFVRHFHASVWACLLAEALTKVSPSLFRPMDWFVNRQVVALFQDARGTAKIFHGAGRHGIVTALPEHEVEERWHHIRKTFLDTKERRGQNRPDAPDAHLQRFEVFYCCLVYATGVYN